MSKQIIDIEEKRTADELLQENEALKREIRAATITIQKLMKDISEKSEKLKSMEGMVKAVIPVIKKEDPPVVRLEVTTEEQIAEIQLERLRSASETRPLTLEEVRAYDILVKNKRLAQDQSTINLTKNDYKAISTDDLLQVAGKVEEEK